MGQIQEAAARMDQERAGGQEADPCEEYFLEMIPQEPGLPARRHSPCEYAGLKQIMERVKVFSEVLSRQMYQLDWEGHLGREARRLGTAGGREQELCQALSQAVLVTLQTYARQGLQDCVKQLEGLGFRLLHLALPAKSTAGSAAFQAVKEDLRRGMEALERQTAEAAASEPPSAPPYRSVLDIDPEIPF